MNLSTQENQSIKVVLINDAKRITYYGPCEPIIDLPSFRLMMYNLDNRLIRDADFDQLFVLRRKYLSVARQEVMDNFVLIFPSSDSCNKVVDVIKKLKNVVEVPTLENIFKVKLFVPLLSEIHRGHPLAEEMGKEVLAYVNGIDNADDRQEYMIIGFQILLIGAASVVSAQPSVAYDRDTRAVITEQESAGTTTPIPIAAVHDDGLQPAGETVPKVEPGLEARCDSAEEDATVSPSISTIVQLHPSVAYDQDQRAALTGEESATTTSPAVIINSESFQPQQDSTPSSHVVPKSNAAEEDAVDTSTSSIFVHAKRKVGRPRKDTAGENGGVAAKSKVIAKTPRASTRYSARLASSLPIKASSTPSSTTTTPTSAGKRGPPRKQ